MSDNKTADDIRKEFLVGIESELRLLNDTYDFGRREPTTYYRGVIYLMYRLVNLQSVGRAEELFDTIPESYITEQLGAELDSDPAYLDIVITLAQKFLDYGVVSLPSKANDVRATQPKAEA